MRDLDEIRQDLQAALAEQQRLIEAVKVNKREFHTLLLEAHASDMEIAEIREYLGNCSPQYAHRIIKEIKTQLQHEREVQETKDWALTVVARDLPFDELLERARKARDVKDFHTVQVILDTLNEEDHKRMFVALNKPRNCD